MRQGHGWHEPQSLLKRRGSVGKLSQILVGIAEIVVGIGMVGIKPESLAKTNNRRVRVALFQKDGAEIVVCPHHARIERDDLPVERFRLREQAALMAAYRLSV